jgi:hypothetical protein
MDESERFVSKSGRFDGVSHLGDKFGFTKRCGILAETTKLTRLLASVGLTEHLNSRTGGYLIELQQTRLDLAAGKLHVSVLVETVEYRVAGNLQMSIQCGFI